MLLKVLLGVCIVIFFVFVPLYDKAYWPEPTKKSLTFKMIAATMFVLIGVIAMLLAENTSRYAKIMVIGLILGWIGDLLMHIPHPKNKPNMPLVYSGAASFLIGHIFYVTAFVQTSAAIKPDYKFFAIPEIIGFIVVYAVFALMLEPVFKFEFASKFMKIGLYVYSIFLVIMLVKSISFAITYFKYGGQNNVIATVILVLGGILFFISDFTLGLRLIGGKKGDKFVKTLSLYTYFLAQLFLSASILFVRG